MFVCSQALPESVVFHQKLFTRREFMEQGVLRMDRKSLIDIAVSSAAPLLKGTAVDVLQPTNYAHLTPNLSFFNEYGVLGPVTLYQKVYRINTDTTRLNRPADALYCGGVDFQLAQLASREEIAFTIGRTELCNMLTCIDALFPRPPALIPYGSRRDDVMYSIAGLAHEYTLHKHTSYVDHIGLDHQSRALYKAVVEARRALDAEQAERARAREEAERQEELAGLAANDDYFGQANERPDSP